MSLRTNDGETYEWVRVLRTAEGQLQTTYQCTGLPRPGRIDETDDEAAQWNEQTIREFVADILDIHSGSIEQIQIVWE